MFSYLQKLPRPEPELILRFWSDGFVIKWISYCHQYPVRKGKRKGVSTNRLERILEEKLVRWKALNKPYTQQHGAV
jgi:hypothetical protein